MISKYFAATCILAIATVSTVADTVTTKDGSTLNGTITLIDKGEIHIDTKYAGKITLQQDEVATFQTEAPIVVRLESGTKMAGPVIASADGKLKIQSEDGVLETNTNKIAASWGLDDVDPEIDRNSRKWQYDVALNLSGKDGNTDKFHFGTDVDIRLKGPDDELRFGMEYEQGDENDNKTDDRALGRIGYERFNADNIGWYVHTALGDRQDQRHLLALLHRRRRLVPLDQQRRADTHRSRRSWVTASPSMKGSRQRLLSHHRDRTGAHL